MADAQLRVDPTTPLVLALLPLGFLALFAAHEHLRFHYSERALRDAAARVAEARAREGAASALAELERRNAAAKEQFVGACRQNGAISIRSRRNPRSHALPARTHAPAPPALVSHEIRTPANAVAGAAALLSAEAPPGQQEVLAVLQAGATTLVAVVDDLLAHGALSQGHLQLACRPFSLVHDVVQARARASAGRGGCGAPLLSTALHSHVCRPSRPLLPTPPPPPHHPPPPQPAWSMLRAQCGADAKLATLSVSHSLDGVPPCLLGDPTRVLQIVLNLRARGGAWRVTRGSTVCVFCCFFS